MFSGVVAYSSSSDEEQDHISNSSDVKTGSEATALPTAKSTKNVNKRGLPDPLPEKDPHKRLKSSENCGSETSLPLPSAIQNLYAGDESRSRNDPDNHGGRVRTFQHVEGNWATFVYIPVEPEARLLELFTSLVKCLRPLKFEMVSDHHVTLSRTVVIRHHWIDSLMDSLKESLSSCVSCICDVLEPRLYTNDEKTRTFLCLGIQKEGTSLPSYVAAVDQCFQEFRLQSYYEDPSFHISIGWCLGDVVADVSTQKMDQMKDLIEDCFKNNPDLSVLEVREIECKTGKKVFRFQLQEDDR